MITMNTGKHLENQAKYLFSSVGYSVTEEILVSSKKADFCLIEIRFGKKFITAVECKDYERTLTQKELAGIYAEYLPAIESKQIDQVLIITRNGISPGGEKYILDSKFLCHSSYLYLQNQVINFSPYLEALISEYENDDVSKYYIQLQAIEQGNLEPQLLHLIVDEWLDKPNDRPLAVLASYGMGKTTFAKKYCSQLASVAIFDPSKRIPILLRLGEISAEQSLEGLLGKMFTSTYQIKGYSFQGFMSLARSGRFLIFLDGFDEMKHTLNWSGFKYNFTQLNRLCVGENRVILLGRPTAFISDEEYKFALHGVRDIANVEIKEVDWPDYIEVTIQPFNKNQVNQFLISYFDNKASEKTKGRTKEYQLTDSTIEKISGRQFSDIARRPVQLKMLSEILPHFKGSIDRITSAVLYDEFINLIIERELEKLSRNRFGKTVRRQFVEDVAWWLWVEKGEMSTIQYQIPDDLILKYCKPKDEIDAVRRDLTSACFLERKYGGSLYFPHRSFQEFLVANHIYVTLSAGKFDLSVLDRVCNPEILEFIKVLSSHRQIAKWTSAFSTYRGTVPWGFIKTCIDNPSNCIFFLTKYKEEPTCPWWQLILSIGYNTKQFNINPSDLSLYTLYFDGKTPPKLSDQQLMHEILSGLLTLKRSEDASMFLNALCLVDSGRRKNIQEFLKKMNFSSKRLGYVDVRAVFKMFGAELPKTACVTEWIKEGIIQTDLVTIPEYIYNGNEIVLEKLRKQQELLRKNGSGA